MTTRAAQLMGDHPIALASCASGCLTIIIIQHSAQPLTALDRSTAAGARLFLHDQLVAQPLMIALVMIVHNEFLNSSSQRAFSEQNHPLQAGFFDLYELKVINESLVRLRKVVPCVGTHFEYLYDFGDSWRHDLLLEAIVLPDLGMESPHCLAGERRTPPEDVGGPLGHEDYLEALADTEHKEHENVLRWRGGSPKIHSPPNN